MGLFTKILLHNSTAHLFIHVLEYIHTQTHSMYFSHEISFIDITTYFISKLYKDSQPFWGHVLYAY